jgi:hypothetical protein
VSCGPSFAAANLTPGTTYRIMIFDAFDTGGGTLRLHIDDAPTIALHVREHTLIDPHGVVHLTGTYSCTHARSLHIFGSLIDIVGDKVAVGRFDTLGVPAPICDGLPHAWTGLVLAPSTSPFTQGNAAVFTHALACGDLVCTQVNKSSVVDLSRTATSSSSLAADTSSSTGTVRLPSGGSYGNARHTETATWGH